MVSIDGANYFNSTLLKSRTVESRRRKVSDEKDLEFFGTNIFSLETASYLFAT